MQVCVEVLSCPWSCWGNGPSITQPGASGNTLSIISLWSRSLHILMNHHHFSLPSVPKYMVPQMPLELGTACGMPCSVGSEHWKATMRIWKRSVFAITQIWVWVLSLQFVDSLEPLFSHLQKGNAISPRGDTKAAWNSIEIMPLGVWYLEGPQRASFLDLVGFCSIPPCLLSVYYVPDTEGILGLQQRVKWPLLAGHLRPW